MARFEEEFPSLDSYWRAVVLFGRNSASYKFALAKVLLDLVKPETTKVTLDQLALPFAYAIAEHLKLSDKQGSSGSSQFLDAVRKFNSGELSESDLKQVTARKGFANVLDAFHNVNNGELPVRFFDRDNNGIVITDDMFRLKEIGRLDDLNSEAEARWRLVETAWSLGLSKNVVQIDPDDDHFNTIITTDRRVDVTSTRDALNGYQKGKCFYCVDDISVQAGSDSLCEVDHFFPFALRHDGIPASLLNGVWNLVLACKDCNQKKSARLPEIRYLERLRARNDFLIESHHPLRETLLNQTGTTAEHRHQFLADFDHRSIQVLIHRWRPENEFKQVF